MANEKLRWLIADVNPKEIASHIECGNLQSWCDRWRDSAYSCLKKEHNAVEVVRCQNCVHAEPLDHNCELSTSHYMHCKLWRGEETKNVWHKYKKYYKDYSLVERDGYCDAGAKMDGGNEDG